MSSSSSPSITPTSDTQSSATTSTSSLSPLVASSSMSPYVSRSPFSAPSPSPLASYDGVEPLPMSSRTNNRNINKPMPIPIPLLISQTLPANVYVQQRQGSILSRSLVLKSDSFPSGATKGMDMYVIGAPNFQRIQPMEIYSSGQPSVSGIRTVLNLLHLKQLSHQRRVLWLNLREEPVIYLNNRPFVLRELEQPMRNMNDFQGIDANRLNQVETRLKKDIMEEAENYYGNILVHDEVEPGEVRACWTSVHDSTIKAANDVFSSLKHNEKYNVDYERVPVTAEGCFEAKQVDIILRLFTYSLQLMSSSGIETCFIINDQMGRGRATVGMVMLFLLQLHAARKTQNELANKVENIMLQQENENVKLNVNHSNSENDGMEQYRRGDFEIMLKLVRMLKNGKEAKKVVDFAIDLCGRVHHLRDTIVDSFLKSEHARASHQSRAFSSYTASYLKRYFFLVCFQAFLQSVDASNANLASSRFSEWWEQHVELQKLIETLNKEEEMVEDLGAQSIADTSYIMPPDATVETAQQAAPDNCSPLDMRVFQRNGPILSKRTIIKSEYFRVYNKDGRRKNHIINDYNFRHLDYLPVSASAQPNLRGIRAIIDEILMTPPTPVFGTPMHAQAQSNLPVNALTRGTSEESVSSALSAEDSAQSPVSTSSHPPSLSRASSLPLLPPSGKILWINLREEPVIFINDEPYLLRDYNHPFRVLSEFNTGLTAERCDQIEEGFKQDIVHELEQFAAPSEPPSILVHEETIYRQIRAREEQTDRQHIKTTKEIFDDLVKHGYNIEYHRVPLQVEEVMGLKSFDRLFDIFSHYDLIQERVNIIYNCQKGGRRSTTGMVVAVLIMMHQGSVDYSIIHPHGKKLQQPLSPNEEKKSDVGGDHQLSITSRIVQPPSDTLHVPSTTSPIKRSTSSLNIHISEMDRPENRARFGRGEYKGILSLIRILKAGAHVKEQVDVAIDVCGSVHNLRDSIASAKMKSESDRANGRGQMLKAIKYLESYAYLIVFNAYLQERREMQEEAQRAKEKQDHIKRLNEEEKRAATAAESESNDEKDTDVNKKRVLFSNDLDVPHPRAASLPSSPALPPFPFPTASAPPAPFQFPAFSAWIHSRPELKLALENLSKEPEDALKINSVLAEDQYANVYDSRCGNVLVKGSILKHDWFKGSMNKDIEQFIEGAINFRPIEEFPVAGTGIPTVEGIYGILQFYTNPAYVNRSVNYKPVFRATSLLWLNLREEPLLYVQNRPFVLRDSDNPYVNLENTGINTRRLEAMERQLKKDVLIEAQMTELEQGESKVLFHDEDQNGNLIAVWQNVTPDNIQTPKEQFYHCFKTAEKSLHTTDPNSQSFTFSARYYRTPITDEQAPSPATLDDLVRYLEAGVNEQHRVLLFNCQMGRGRTTTGLIIASLWCIHRQKVDPTMWKVGDKDTRKSMTLPTLNKQSSAGSKVGTTILASMAADVSSSTNDSISSPLLGSRGFAANNTLAPPSAQDENQKLDDEFNDSLKHGWYKVIQSLVRVLPNGPATKKQVDKVIDWCGTFQNLRNVVYETQVLVLTCLERKRAFFIKRGTNYLIRYFFLILINAYFLEQVHDDFNTTFVQWLNDRPEIQNILSTLQFPEVRKKDDNK